MTYLSGQSLDRRELRVVTSLAASVRGGTKIVMEDFAGEGTAAVGGPRGPGPDDRLVERARRLFDFLTRVQELRRAPIRHVDSYERDGAVVWLHDVPSDAAVALAGQTEGLAISPDSPLLTLERVRRLAPPDVPDDLVPWLEGRIDDPDAEPTFKDRIEVPAGHLDGDAVDERRPVESVALDDHPEIGEQLLKWFETWTDWAAAERKIRPVRRLYDEIFRMYNKLRDAGDEWEAVVGLCALGWHPDGHEPVLRHCFTHELDFDFDDDTGRLTVAQSPNASLSLELDMLDAGLWPDHSLVQELREACDAFADHVLDVDRISELSRRLLHNLSGDATYSEEAQPPGSRSIAAGAFAPALILRKRNRAGLMEIFQSIKAQLVERGTVPDGIKILLDPDLAGSVVEAYSPAEGAWIEDGDEVYLPKPVNDRQLEVVRRVDNRALTLVQGPPGTGKTHTAAVLISHLLAQGKRVLVTAQTDRALKELRSQLPAEIRDLSVSIVGTGREEMAELRAAVRKLSQESSDHNEAAAAQEMRTLEQAVDNLRKQKAVISRQLLEAREAETLVHERGPYRGTLARMAVEHGRHSDEFGWLAALSTVPADAPAPLTSSEAGDLLRLLRDGAVQDDEGEARRDLPDLDRLPSPAAFADLVGRYRAAKETTLQHAGLRQHDSYAVVAALPQTERRALRERVDRLADRADELARRPEAWLSEALADVRSGKRQKWQRRDSEIAELITQLRPLLETLGRLADVRTTAPEPASLLPHVVAVRAFLAEGKTIRVDPTTGQPKQGVLTSKVIKDAEPLFGQVLVNGLPPTTIEQLDTFATWVEATRCAGALDRAWPSGVMIPEEDTLAERLAWHEDEQQVLRSVIDLGRNLVAEETRLAELGIPRPDWNDLAGVRRFAQLVDAADGMEDFAAAEQPLAELGAGLQAFSWDPAPVVVELRNAVEQRDEVRYARAYQRLERLAFVRWQADRRDGLLARLRTAVPTVARQLEEMPFDDHWDVRLPRFEEAWSWAATASWIRDRSTVDVNTLQESYTQVEDEIRAKVTTLAAIRAWSKAVDRLGPRQRADLMQYAQLVQGFGKTGGKYRERKLANIKDAMQRCRPAVPVWIMPLYRISQSFRVDADLFDVVIVDEASQAGMDATFLQYLAPKMVVIGDDKQVSPYGVGVDQAQLQALARQYLFDDRYRASWEDPNRSLFDEARMRFGDLVTLVEHRRCVPDIIGFSNRIAYEPDNIRLIPVRQTGTDALRPICPVFVEDGYYRGNNVNPAEVEAIVEQVEKCLADERYDHMTFGVISLTGAYQAAAIDEELRKRIDPREWEARDLRCGTAADFQGSERDVMFLSMVATLEESRRYAPLTGNKYVQQFNVAASRAKDQMWVFHSIRPEELTNKEDMRFQLLDYCYAVSRRGTDVGDGRSSSPVPEDRIVPPFESLFEQRVHNRIYDRGHVVIPQYESGYRRIDLVVVGGHSKLAVECDGDHWHGPEQYERDLVRQRELERCGWKFFRVRESEFNIDPAMALGPLWDLLETEEIWPAVAAPHPDVAGSPDREPRRVGAETDITVVHESEPPEAHIEQELNSAREAVTQLSDDLAGELSGRAHTASEAAVEFRRPLSGAVELRPYREWDTAERLDDPKLVRPADRIEVLRRIVEIEGPILGYRLYQVYVKSSGRSRVGREYRQILNGASAAATRVGLLVASNPLNEEGQTVKTFRLPDQPEALLRELGPRRLTDVPPAELAAVMRAVRDDFGDEEEWFRATLAAYGLIRLTDNSIQYLKACAKLV